MFSILRAAFAPPALLDAALEPNKEISGSPTTSGSTMISSKALGTMQWVVVSALPLVLLAGAANAGIINALTPIDGANTSDIGSGNDGLFFTVGSSPIDVTALGYYHDGAVHTNDVGIFRVSDQDLLVSTFVTTTAESLPDPSFDYTSITPFTLSVNTEYTVVGLNNNVVSQYVTSDLEPSAGITYDGYEYNNNNFLSFPTAPYVPAYIGPDFQFNVVPEPASLAVLGLGAMGLLARRPARKLKENLTASFDITAAGAR